MADNTSETKTRRSLMLHHELEMEITHLKEDLKLSEQHNRDQCREIERLRAENERLRSELRRIVQHYEARSELYTSDEDLASGMAAIARQAL